MRTVFFRVSPQHLSASAGCCGGHQQQQRVWLRLPRQRSQRQPFHLQAQPQMLQREGCQGDQIAVPQVGWRLTVWFMLFMLSEPILVQREFRRHVTLLVQEQS